MEAWCNKTREVGKEKIIVWQGDNLNSAGATNPFQNDELLAYFRLQLKDMVFWAGPFRRRVTESLNDESVVLPEMTSRLEGHFKNVKVGQHSVCKLLHVYLDERS